MSFDTALFVIDMKNDFMDNGTLPVKGARALVPTINRIMATLPENVMIFDIGDWHGLESIEFKGDNPWPLHCVQNTLGAETVTGLELPEGTLAVRKGIRDECHGYDVFEDGMVHVGDGQFAYINEFLMLNNIKKVWGCGVVDDICVTSSLVGARIRGYEAAIIYNATQALSVEGAIKGEKTRAEHGIGSILL